MKRFAKAILTYTPYRIIRRTSANRFQAIDEALLALKNRGWSPDVIIDGGANVGAFSETMLKLFPAAMVHAIEPQPGCQADLKALARRWPSRLHLHFAALSAPGHGDTGQMLTDAAARSTGAMLSLEPKEGRIRIDVPVTTLDNLMENCKID